MDFLLNIFLLVLILGGSAVLTNWFTRIMYTRCHKCGALNAKRRNECRICAQSLTH
ncbi:MAG: hypothetical protein MK025_00495 [Acidobacteriia bacterium]|jgi:hypothetical protein|nr:hypothetical protein [Terriglobia bacterium]